MLVDFRGVALRTVRYSDRASILTAWSPVAGRVSLLVSASNSAPARRVRALTMPLSLFEGITDIRPGRDIHALRDVRPYISADGSGNISSNPVRSTVAMFVAEVLTAVTREGDSDNALWRLVLDTVTAISNGNAAVLANIPVMFLVRLAALNGIAPDLGQWDRSKGLDTLEGVFRLTRPDHGYWLDATSTRAVVTTMRAADDYRHAGLLRLNRNTRGKLLDSLLDYFTLHHIALDRLKSVDILKSVFSA